MTSKAETNDLSLVPGGLERWRRDLRQRSLEEEVERHYSSLSGDEREEDSEWAGLASRVLGETWS